MKEFIKAMHLFYAIALLALSAICLTNGFELMDFLLKAAVMYGYFIGLLVICIIADKMFA